MKSSTIMDTALSQWCLASLDCLSWSSNGRANRTKCGYNVIDDAEKSTSNHYNALCKHTNIMFSRHQKEFEAAQKRRRGEGSFLVKSEDTATGKGRWTIW
eukprot:1069944-Ditylum_brightwellii.AAC.1